MRRLVLALVMCLALLTACFGCAQQTPAPGGVVLEIDGQVGLAAAVALTDNHIQSMVSSMQILAMTDEVKTGKWDTMSGLLTKFKENEIPAVVWFALPNGSYYSAGSGLASGNLSYRAYFPKVMSGSMVVGDLIVSKSTGRKSVIATVPVEKNGNVIGALGVSVYLDDLSGVISGELQLPSNMVFYAVNQDGYIALHTDSQWLMQKAADIGSKTFSDAVAEMLLKSEGSATYEFGGKSETVIFDTMPVTGWRIAIGEKSG